MYHYIFKGMYDNKSGFCSSVGCPLFIRSLTFFCFLFPGARWWGIAEAPRTSVSISLIRAVRVRNSSLVPPRHWKWRGAVSVTVLLKAHVTCSFLADFRMKQGWTKVDNQMLSFVLWGGLLVALPLNFQQYGVVFMDRVSIKQMALLQLYFQVL